MDTIILKNRTFVLVPIAEYDKLAAAAAAKASTPVRTAARGNRPAVAFADESIARSIVQGRKAAGLSQKELAALAGIRVEVLNRAERGAVTPSVQTLMKIENALKRSTRRSRSGRA